MKFKPLLAAFTLSSATALASPHDGLAAARDHVQAATTRVSYLELEITIAERDVATARIIQDTATKQRGDALREHDDKAASAAAKRHAEAVKDEREATARAAEKRSSRERALADLQASTARAKELERGTRASR